MAAHIRRGDVGDARHFRYVSTHRWSVGLLSVAEAALRESAASASPQLRIFVLVVTELPWGPAQRANISRPLAALNRTARGAGRIYYAERVGGDPLEAFAHLAAADVRVLVQTTERIYSLINVLTRSRAYLLTLQVLAASDSHFSIAAAQLSLGVHLRIRRQGFAAADVQHMVPLPLMGSDAEARARVRVNRNRGCAEDGQHAQRGPAPPARSRPPSGPERRGLAIGLAARVPNRGRCSALVPCQSRSLSLLPATIQDEAVLAARSGAIFGCRLRGYLEWRADLAQQLPTPRPGGLNSTGGVEQCVV